MNCVLCQLSEADVVYSTDYWRVVTNHNQNKLGKCMVCLQRHDEDICNLSDEEVHDLWAVVKKLKSGLVSCFQPDHFNYAFLMNQDAHVHLHVIPRYHGPRVIAGIEFQDSEAITERRLPEYLQTQMMSVLRRALY